MVEPFRTILLATQCTEFDAGAERVGIELAAKCGLPLYAVLPLVSNAEYETLAPMLENVAEAKAAEDLQKLRETAAARGVTLVGTVRLGDEPFREILSEASEREADLIVLRRRGRRGFLANLLLGEMVHAVISHTTCDVLIVPPEASIWSRAIVLATDGSPHSQRASQVAARVAAQWALPLTVVSIATADDPDGRVAKSHVDSTLATIRAAGASADGQIASGKPHDAILRMGEQAGADLIVLGRGGSGPIKRALLGTTSEHVARHANGPVLIVRANT